MEAAAAKVEADDAADELNFKRTSRVPRYEVEWLLHDTIEAYNLAEVGGRKCSK